MTERPDPAPSDPAVLEYRRPKLAAAAAAATAPAAVPPAPAAAVGIP
jgi:hypothetical protein